MKRYFICSNDRNNSGIYLIEYHNKQLFIKDFIKTEGLPSFLLYRNEYLYVTFKNNSINNGAGIGSYYIDNDHLYEHSFYNSSGRSYVHLCIDPSDQYLFTANYNVGATALYKLNHYMITSKLSSYHHDGRGPDVLKRQLSPHAHYVGFTPDNNLYSVDLGADKVYLYTYNDNLLEVKQVLNVLPGSGPRSMLFSENGLYAYVVNEISNQVLVYKYNCHTFSLLQSTHCVPRHFNGFSCASAMKLSKSGNYLFVGNRGHDSIAMYRVNKDNGKLSLLYMVHTLKDPVDFIIDDDLIIVLCHKSDIIQVLHFNEEEELLEMTDLQLSISSPISITY